MPHSFERDIKNTLKFHELTCDISNIAVHAGTNAFSPSVPCAAILTNLNTQLYQIARFSDLEAVLVAIIEILQDSQTGHASLLCDGMETANFFWYCSDACFLLHNGLISTSPSPRLIFGEQHTSFNHNH